jgi:hypothetical protein
MRRGDFAKHCSGRLRMSPPAGRSAWISVPAFPATSDKTRRPSSRFEVETFQGLSGRERTQALIPPIPIESLPANPAGSGHESENTNPP